VTLQVFGVLNWGVKPAQPLLQQLLLTLRGSEDIVRLLVQQQRPLQEQRAQLSSCMGSSPATTCAQQISADPQ
jgi:hypothetical protein